MAVNSETEVTFVISEMQMENDKKIAASLGKVFKCGNVSAGSSTKKYSKIVKDDADFAHMIALYPDTKIVAKGKLSQMSYTEATIAFR